MSTKVAAALAHLSFSEITELHAKLLFRLFCIDINVTRRALPLCPKIKMRVRSYTDADLEHLRAMHAAQGFAYEFPDIDDPLFLVREVVEADGRPRMAALLRLTAETYLLADPADGTPRERWGWLTALHESASHAARSRGLADVQAFLPPRIARGFGRRLNRMGWHRDPWPCYTRVL